MNSISKSISVTILKGEKPQTDFIISELADFVEPQGINFQSREIKHGHPAEMYSFQKLQKHAGSQLAG